MDFPDYPLYGYQFNGVFGSLFDIHFLFVISFLNILNNVAAKIGSPRAYNTIGLTSVSYDVIFVFFFFNSINEKSFTARILYAFLREYYY